MWSRRLRPSRRQSLRSRESHSWARRSEEPVTAFQCHRDGTRLHAVSYQSSVRPASSQTRPSQVVNPVLMASSTLAKAGPASAARPTPSLQKTAPSVKPSTPRLTGGTRECTQSTCCSQTRSVTSKNSTASVNQAAASLVQSSQQTRLALHSGQLSPFSTLPTEFR